MADHRGGERGLSLQQVYRCNAVCVHLTDDTKNPSTIFLVVARHRSFSVTEVPARGRPFGN